MPKAQAFSHLILAGTGIFCLTQYDSFWKGTCGTYTIIIIHSACGVWHCGRNLIEEDNIAKTYKLTGLLQNLFAMSWVTTESWYDYGYMKATIFHMLLPLLPIVVHLLDFRETKEAVLNFMTDINCASLCFISLIYKNYYGVVTSFTYLVSYFYIAKEDMSICFLSPIESFNYALCAFCYLLLWTVKTDCSNVAV